MKNFTVEKPNMSKNIIIVLNWKNEELFQRLRSFNWTYFRETVKSFESQGNDLEEKKRKKTNQFLDRVFFVSNSKQKSW